MNAPEKFNQAIEKIEELVPDSAISASEIGQIIAKSNGLGVRDMSAIFRYLVDKTLNEYINERKLTAAYRHLVTSTEKGKIHSAIEIAGYGDQPTFIKAFKRMFGITPGDAQKHKDLTLLSPPTTWDFLSGNLTSEIQDEESEAVMEEQSFGIPESNYETVIKVLDLEAFYGFSSMFSKYAFELSEKTKYSLEDCFRYVESLREFGGDFVTGYDDELTPFERLHACGDNEAYQLLFFSRGISVHLSWTLMNEHFVKPEELLSCDPEMLKYFPGFENGVDIAFSYFVKAYNYYTEHFDIENTEDSFNEYLDYILFGYTIETALEEVYGFALLEQTPCEELDDYYNPDEDLAEIEKYSEIEALAEEEARWRGKRIDDDLYYDPENISYDQLFQEDEEW